MAKLKMMKPKRQYRVEVEDRYGSRQTFECVKDLAEAMGVTRQSIYIAISRGIPVCGCKVRKIQEQ